MDTDQPGICCITMETNPVFFFCLVAALSKEDSIAEKDPEVRPRPIFLIRASLEWCVCVCVCVRACVRARVCVCQSLCLSVTI